MPTRGATSRLRLLLEGSRTFAFGAARSLTPTLELGVCRDGGDAETGAGIDLGGTLRYADAGLGLTLDASASLRADPGTAGRGLSLSVTPSWGPPRPAALSGCGRCATATRAGAPPPVRSERATRISAPCGSSGPARLPF